MLHLLVILMLAAIAVHKTLVADGGVFAAYYRGAIGWWTIPIALGPYVVLAALAWLVCRAAGRMVDAGDRRALFIAERTCGIVRLGTALVFAAGVLMAGWLDLVRSVVGNTVLLDEAVALLPALATLCASWAAQHSIERRIREAVMMRELDTGAVMYPMPSRGRFVLNQLRHQVLLSLVPIMMLMGWAEGAERIADWLAARRGVASGLLAWLGTMTADRSTRSSVLLVVQLFGVGVVLSLAPVAMRFVWDAVRVAPGPLRDRLIAMCREHRVGVRDVLVWRTHGAMINGVVMGLWGRFRYILLTDALLDAMPRAQVEAVMAHELGHVRHRHIPWLAAVMLAALGVLAGVGSLVLSVYHAVLPGDPESLPALALAGWGLGAMVLEILVALGMLVGAIFVFAFVSRRFEWQADASAAAYLSTHVPEAQAPGPDSEVAASSGPVVTEPVVTEPGVRAMAGALRAVARLNHIPLSRGSWRHGSLADRIRRLESLVGLPLDKLPVNAAAGRIKLAALAALVLFAGAIAWSLL